MRKIGLTADIHLQLGKRSNYIDYIYKSLNFFFEECKKDNIFDIFMLGDIVEYKDKIDVFVLNSMLDFFREKKDQGFFIRFLVGNHETVRRADNDINFLNVFSREFEVYKDYTVVFNGDTILHFLPFFKDDILQEMIPKIKNSIQSNAKNYLFTHLAFKNFDLGGGHEDVYSEIESKQFEALGFTHIYSGHFHKRQTIGKTTYVSSPMMTNFGELGEEEYHGFLKLDLMNNSTEFIQNPHLIKFKRYELNSKTLPIMMKETNCYLEVILTKNYNYLYREKLKEALERNNYKVRFQYDISKKNQTIAKIDDWTNILAESKEQIIEKFIHSKPLDDIIKKELLEYLK